MAMVYAKPQTDNFTAEQRLEFRIWGGYTLHFNFVLFPSDDGTWALQTRRKSIRMNMRPQAYPTGEALGPPPNEPLRLVVCFLCPQARLCLRWSSWPPLLTSAPL